MEFKGMGVEHLEDQLRAEGAPLPAELRTRVLQRCHEERHARQCWYRRFDLRLSGTFAGLCLFYWIAIGLLDAQRTALMAPANSGSDAVLMVGAPASTPGDLERAMQSRSQVLAALLNGNGGWYGEEVDYVSGSTASPHRTSADAQSG